MSRKNIILIIISLFLIEAVFCSAQAWISLNDLSDQKQLEENIIKTDKFTSAAYSHPKYNAKEIEQLVKIAKDSIPETVASEEANKRLDDYQKTLTESKKNVIFFFMEKDYVQYFISIKDKNPEQSYCRLAVKSNHFLVRGLEKVNIFLKSNHEEYEINQSICNGLFSYGSTKY